MSQQNKMLTIIPVSFPPNISSSSRISHSLVGYPILENWYVCNSVLVGFGGSCICLPRFWLWNYGVDVGLKPSQQSWFPNLHQIYHKDLAWIPRDHRADGRPSPTYIKDSRLLIGLPQFTLSAGIALSATMDLLIAGILIYHLHSSKTGFKE